jgi:hypothetical protein
MNSKNLIDIPDVLRRADNYISNNNLIASVITIPTCIWHVTAFIRPRSACHSYDAKIPRSASWADGVRVSYRRDSSPYCYVGWNRYCHCMEMMSVSWCYAYRYPTYMRPWVLSVLRMLFTYIWKVSSLWWVYSKSQASDLLYTVRYLIQ